MAIEDTNEYISSQPAVGDKLAGQVIDAESFRDMVNILDSLLDHQHNFSDNYVSNCECQCSNSTI